MNSYVKFAVHLGAFGLLAIGAMPQADAALGGTDASVQADQAQLGATIRTTPNARYTLHELKVASRTTVRQYVSPAGTVFGVAWEGSSLPDMRQLLGSHFDEYAAALAARRTRRTPVLVQLPTLVVQSSGHMRAFTGKAYLPQGVPQGVDASEIQ